MKITPKRFIMTALAVIGLVLGVWAFLFHARPEWELADYRKDLARKGEKLDLDEVLPRPTSPEANGARIFQKASGLFMLTSRPGLLETNPPQAMRMVAPGKAVLGWRERDLHDEGTNSWEDAESALAESAPALELLEQIIDKPVLDFQLDFHQGFSLLLPHLAQLKQSAQKLKAAAVLDLHRDDTASATKEIRASLALVKGMTGEPLIISQLVRFAMANIALTGNWELLQSPHATDEQLAALQRDWTELDFLKASEAALVLERAMSEETAERMRNSSAEFRNALGIARSPPSASGNWVDQAGRIAMEKVKESTWRYAWGYPDQLRALKGLQVILEAVRSVQHDQSFEVALRVQDEKLKKQGIEPKPKEDGLLMDGSDPRFMFTRSVLSLQRFVLRLQTIEVSRQLVVTAIALKRFQLRHGSNPAALADLCPGLLPTVPRDPVHGKPLRYQLKPDGTFALYSVGENAIDDGGDPTPPPDTKTFPWLKGKDQVWPQVATEAEIAADRANARSRRQSGY